MSTIHSTFNRVNTSYTVIGNKKQSENSGNGFSITALILNRGGRPFRRELYNELSKLNILEIISIEIGTKSHFDLEKQSQENESLRFLILKDEVSIGEMINIGISESSSNLVFVLWDDMVINSKSISYRVFDKIFHNEHICTVPLVVNSRGDRVPTFMTPLFDREMLKVVPLVENKNLKTLFPYMYVGLYNKNKFIRLGGYDIDIRNSYWQKLDFGLRSNMWGDEIFAHESFLLTISDGGSDIDDITPDKDYRLYCLKNLSVVIKKDVGYLPIRRFFAYYEKSGSSLREAIATFRNVRKWVFKNRFRFKVCAPSLTTHWDDQ